MQPKYKRVLLKLSGESLAGKAGHGIDFDTVLKICEPIKQCVDLGVEVIAFAQQICAQNFLDIAYRHRYPPCQKPCFFEKKLGKKL